MRRTLSTRALAEFASRRPWRVIGAWSLLVVAALAATALLLGGALTSEGNFNNRPESKRAEELVEARLGGPEGTNETIVVSSASLTVDDPAFRAKVNAVARDVDRLPDDVIARVTDPFAAGDPALISPDRHSALVPVQMAGDESTAEDDVPQMISVLERANGQAGFTVVSAGPASSGYDYQQTSASDLATGEMFGLAAALLVLIIVFGAVVASLVPIITSIVSIVVALGLTALVGQAVELSFFVTNMLVMMGLAVGIDYSLFVLSRFREERRGGADKHAAIAATASTATRAVVFSGVTVVVALVGMLLIPTTVFRSLAIGAMAAVIVAVLAALTLLPALMSLLGDRVESLRVPIFGRWAERAADSGGRSFWARVAGAVMRRPGISLAASVIVLVALSLPAFGIATGESGPSSLPKDTASRTAFGILDRDFTAGRISPAEIVIDGDATARDVRDGIATLRAELPPERFGPATVQARPERDLTVVRVPIDGDPTGEAAMTAVRDLRERYVPAAFGSTGADVLVGGRTAQTVDFVDLTNDYWPIVVGFILLLSVVLLTIAFRSIVVPLTSVAVNLLSVGAAYGLLVLVFQEGIGADLLGFQQLDVIEAWLPLFLFTVLFGLSMDYQVFLVSRIRERFDQTGDNTEAVRFGVGSTSRIITGAAIIMVAVFAGFAAGELVSFQQMGFGLAVAVLIDATIVRSVRRAGDHAPARRPQLVPAARAALAAADRDRGTGGAPADRRGRRRAGLTPSLAPRGPRAPTRPRMAGSARRRVRRVSPGAASSRCRPRRGRTARRRRPRRRSGTAGSCRAGRRAGSRRGSRAWPGRASRRRSGRPRRRR